MRIRNILNSQISRWGIMTGKRRVSCPDIALHYKQQDERKKAPSPGKVQKSGRSYDASVKRKIVQEVNAGLLSHRAAAKKYGLNRKTIDAWVSERCYLNLQPLQVAQEIMANGKQETGTRVLAKQVQDLTRELEKAKLKISSLETLIEVSEEELKIKIRKKPGTKRSQG